MQAVILVGGLGTRLGVLTKDTPKPLMPIGDRPFLEYLIQNLSRFGFTNILLLAGFRADKIENHFRDLKQFEHLDIKYSIEKEPAGTAGALRIAENQLQDEFLLINGDTFFDMNYLDLVVHDNDLNWIGKMAVKRMECSDRYGSVKLDGSYVVGFVEKGQTLENVLINCGVYYFRKAVLDYIHELPCSLENQVLPKLVSDRALLGVQYDGYFIDIGIPSDLIKAQAEMPTLKRPAVFFDRDGVLNKDEGYTHLPEHFEWNPGAKEAVKLVNDLGYYAVVVTNQAGVARGFYDEDTVNRLHFWMNQELKKIGAHIDAFYYCPHHPQAGTGEYLKDCNCRKPKPGMLLRAAEELNIDMQNSLLIGDKDTDLAAAQSAEVNAFKYQGGSLFDFIMHKIR